MHALGFFSEQLADSMARKNLTGKALAPRVMCSYEYIRKMLNGQSVPAIPLLRRLCAEFGWSEREVCRFVMIDQARKRFGDTFWIVLGKTPQLEPLYILWEYLTPEEREFFVELLRLIVNRQQKSRKGSSLSLISFPQHTVSEP
jgi:hypothetical protein